MTDRELLENAAKAAGIDLHVEWTDAGPTGRYRNGADGDTWNPLTDDGDALRLAVKLRLSIGYDTLNNDRKHTANPDFVVEIDFSQRPIKPCNIYEILGDDPGLATRCAIVRAAAEIGRAMP